MRTPAEHVDALVARGGYSADVIQPDGDWISITRTRLERFARDVQDDAATSQPEGRAAE